VRRLLVALAVLALLAVAVFVAAALALDPASLREPLAALASERLERPVELGEMQLDLFPVPAVHVAEVRVGAERPADPPLAEVAEIRLRPALLPLLLGRVVVRSLEIRSPVIRLPLDDRGLPKPPRSGGGRGSPSPEPGGSGAPLMAIDSIRVDGGRLEAGPWQVENLTIDGGLRPDASASFDLEADLPGLARLREVQIDVEGLLGAERVATFEGRLEDADLATLGQRLGYDLELSGKASGSFSARVEASELVAATLDLDATGVEVEAEAFSLRGQLPLHAELGGPFSLDLSDAALDVGEALRKPVGGELRATGTLPARLPPEQLEHLEIWLGPSRVPLSVDLREAAPRVAVAAATIELEPLRDWIVDPPAGLAGRIEVEQLALRSDPPSASGRVHLAEVAFELEGGPVVVSGPVNVGERELVADPLEVRVGGELLQASARYPIEPGTSTFTVTAEQAQLGTLAEVATGKRDVDGTLAFRAKLDASDGFTRLAGDGRLEVTNGLIQGFSIAEQVLGELAALPLIVGQLRGKDLTRYFEEEFDLLSSTFRLENNELVTNDLTIVQDYTRAELRGRVGVLDGALDMSGRLVIGEALDAELSGAERGREKVIPITGVGGTVSRPKVRLDQRALAEVAAAYATGGPMREKLEETVGPEGAQAVQDLLEQLLRGKPQPK
jgi:hypothetical protein